MINRRSTLALAAGALVLAAPGLSIAQDWKAKYPEIVMAIVPAENASGMVDRYTPFAKYLEKELGMKVTLRVANDYTAVIEGMKNRQIHIGFFGPGSYARAYAVSNGNTVAVHDHAEPGRLDRLLFGRLCEGRQPLQDARRSQGQEARPGRRRVDLRLQGARASSCHATARRPTSSSRSPR